VGWDAHARVRDADYDLIVFANSDVHAYHCVLRVRFAQRMHGIDQQVDEHLSESRRIAHDGRNGLVGALELCVMANLIGDKAQTRLEDLSDIHRDDLLGIRPRKGGYVAYDVGDALRAVLNYEA